MTSPEDEAVATAAPQNGEVHPAPPQPSAPASERLHRYALVRPYASGKRVVVVNERHTALVSTLRGYAASVTAVTLDVFASQSVLPLPDGSADIVVAFSGLERMSDPAGFIRDAARVVGQNGVFWVAFPAIGGGAWTLSDVQDGLQRNFRQVGVYAQRHVRGSFLAPATASDDVEDHWFVRDPGGLRAGLVFERGPATYLAVCSAGTAMPSLRSSLFDEVVTPRTSVSIFAGATEPGDEAPRDALRRLRGEIALRERQLQGFKESAALDRESLNHALNVAHRREAQLLAQSEAAMAAEKRLAALGESLALSKAELLSSRERIADLNRLAEERAAALSDREAHIAERDAHIAERDAQQRALEEYLRGALVQALAERDDFEQRAAADGRALRDILGSASWRITKPLRIAGRLLKSPPGGNA